MSAPPTPDIIPYPTQIETSLSDGDAPDSSITPPFHFPGRFVRTGAWLLNYNPVGSSLVAYDGTIRVDAGTNGKRASGDLYQRPTIRIPFPRPRTILFPPPSPADGIPVQNIGNYRYYLRVTKLIESLISRNTPLELGLQMFLFTPTSNGSGTWSTTPVSCTATMNWIPAPAGYPSSNDYQIYKRSNYIVEGDLKQDGTNIILGHLKMGWLSKFLRKATIEIDAVAGSEVPLDSGDGHNWQTVGDSMGYDLKVEVSERNVPEVSGESWADNELNDTMITHRDEVNLNAVWHYHILAVHQLDSTPRGIMYDSSATDSNHVPREGLGISTHWIIEPKDKWGTVGGMRFGLAKAPHFRTAVHELGHAFGLNHNTVDMGFMNTSDVIAAAGTPANPFPTNIKWAFADDDLQRLRHWPDIFIRPGGVPFGVTNSTNPPITPDDRALTLEIPDLTLELTPLLSEVPIGAPVRVDLKLINNSDAPITIPKRFDLKSTCLQGVVRDAAGSERSFRSLIGCVDELPLTSLKPGKSVVQSLTLLRGGDGALFPISGVSEISVSLRWVLPSAGETGLLPDATVTGRTTVFITGASTAAHAQAAHRLLTTPDVHLVLALGGTHLKDGCEAVEMGVENEVLGKHWNAVKAKALAKAGKKEYGKQVFAGKDTPVMSGDEKTKLQKLLR